MNIQTFMLPSQKVSPELEILHADLQTEGQHPPILFLHGYTSGAWQFAQHWMPTLQANGWQSFALNLRGHGGSAGRETVTTARFLDYADDVARAIAYVRGQTDQTPILIGHSLGSVLARHYAAEHSVPGLGLLITIGMQGFMGWMMKRYPLQGMAGMMTGRPSAMFAKFGPQYDVMYAGHNKETVRGNVERLMAQPDSDKVFMDLSKLKLGLPAKSTPTFVMAGTRDPIASVESVEALGRSYAVEPVMLQDKAHDIVAGPDWNDGLQHLQAWLETAKF
ncbi:alpha/beta hydrolase [Jannaschia sp. CCS1]|uniref:alpha/beta hydrolase n=1 Tax=Jannaschia sp. (strain CCS1) TaxID=290400 RepID=UPI000053A404|nr:alpha/beta fold hydrolase [Jannaschia sp. CCS1]ABD53020.1 alpha/beta hydrolase [Jannaschia sp. CCS1]